VLRYLLADLLVKALAISLTPVMLCCAMPLHAHGACMPCSLGCPADAAHVLHAHDVFAGMAVQDTGGFFIAVLEKVAPTPPLEDPKLGHRYGVCKCRSRISAPARAGLCWAVMPVLHDCRTAAWLQARCSSACPMQDVCADMCYWLSCRFLTYVQSAAKPARVVKLDGQDPLQGAADAAEAAIQVGTISPGWQVVQDSLSVHVSSGRTTAYSMHVLQVAC
jgi:hypothetical protein